MTHHPVDHALVLALLVAIPVEGVFAYRSLRARLERGNPDARVASYRRGIVLLWGLAGLVAADWVGLGRGSAELGLAAPDGILGWGVLAAALAFAVFQVRGLRTMVGDPAERERLRERLGHLGPMLPTDDRELRWFSALSVTAGVTEELVYRGFLIAYLAAWVGVWPAVLLSSVVFGLGHAYQGGTGPMLQTGTIGLVLATVYVLGGSLWAPMILHAVVDLTSGWAARQVLGQERRDRLRPS